MRTCVECSAELRVGAAFCGRCGAAAVAEPTPRRVPGQSFREGRRLVAALKLWGLLLVLNGVTGLVAGSESIEPAYLDLGATLAGLVIIAAFVARDPAARAGLTTAGARSGLLWSPLALAALFGFMWAYWALLLPRGVEVLDMSEDYRAVGWGPLLPILLVVVVPPLAEEVFFRGALQSRLEGFMGSREALVVQAALFSVLHMLPLVFVSHFVIGLVLGLLRTRTGSLWPGIAVHAAWNGWVLYGDWVG